MHKVAVIGMFGSVAKIDREIMHPSDGGPSIYAQLCDDILYSIQLNTPILKKFGEFTKQSTIYKKNFELGRRTLEYLVRPDYEITLALANDRSKEFFNQFRDQVVSRRGGYGTTFGILKCPAYFDLVSADVDVSEEQVGRFETSSIVSDQHKIVDLENLELSFEQVPTKESQKMYYDPDKLIRVVSFLGWDAVNKCRRTIQVSGPYRSVNKEKTAWFL
jgi:hypothetical protein